MAHKLEMRNDGILRLALLGDVGKEEIEAYVRDVTPFLEAATEAEPVRILSDSSRTGKTSSAARKVYTRLTRDPRIGKTAVLGAKRYHRVLGSFLLKATGQDNIRFFDSEEEALAWLNAES